ncbi:MAG: polysulfide reductase NrfD [candidate division NC10 bacterium]|nr:polysulfide reductase NrfD [candidate division NC10 bacterium]
MQPLTFRQVDRDILRTMEPPGRLYYGLLALVLAVILWGVYAWWYQIQTGLAVAGLNNPVGWGAYITNFVFWVGIAHSGTLISAILYLFRARWRTAVYRSAEAMTVFAIMTAGLFPLIHLGRPWYFYWLLPYPNQRNLWPNFQSPLLWDVVAIGTYMTVSVTFFFIGLIPDLATARDQATGWRRLFYGILSLGWRGSDREWRHYRSGYLFFAALATPLVVSVHSVVSWDFAMSIVPGWHSTIFAPYFVAGAIHSGLAMVITILLPLRRIFRLEAYLLPRHFENLAKLIIVTGLIVGYAYLVEFFLAWYSGNVYEHAVFLDRATGHYAPEFWIMVTFNAVLPLLFFIRRVRTSPAWLVGISLGITIGMWFERFVTIVASLAHSYIPFSWGLYRPTWVELSITAGSFAWFLFWFLLFAKFLPSVSMTEVKEQIPEEAG